MKRKRTCKAKKTIQIDAVPVTELEPTMSCMPLFKSVCDERTEENRGRPVDSEVGQNDKGRMEINTTALGQMIATIIKEISKEAGGLANLSRSLMVDNSISNGQTRQPHVNMEPEGNKNQLHQNPELKAALAVIKSTMELDAADPFNRPVDPRCTWNTLFFLRSHRIHDALASHITHRFWGQNASERITQFKTKDYFDIIDTPMDFGTICTNLENGLKYMNSAQVFKDVQCIWYNCIKYNKKGDHILELMTQVKTYFIKYWKAAGLQTEPSPPLLDPLPPSESSILRHSKQQNYCSLTPLSNNITQLQLRESGSNQIAEKRPGSSNMQTDQPQRSSEQDVPDIGTVDSTNTQKKHQVRGPKRGLKLLSTVGRIKIATNELGQPVGPEATQLTSFLGLTARDGNLAPLTYPSWSKMPKEKKENIWEKVLTRFDIDPSCRKWVMLSLRSKWRNFKFYLKTSRYDTHATVEQRLADRDERVPPDQWSFLVSQWSSDQWKNLSARNKAKRAKVRFNHTAGTKSFARLLEEERAKRPHGREPSQAELFILTRTHKNGEPVNEATAAVISQLRASTTQDDMSSLCGLNVISSLPWTTVVPTRADALKMVKEKNAEVLEMKVRLASVERTCSQMAAQMSAMVSMMTTFQNCSPAKYCSNAVHGRKKRR